MAANLAPNIGKRESGDPLKKTVIEGKSWSVIQRDYYIKTHL